MSLIDDFRQSNLFHPFVLVFPIILLSALMIGSWKIFLFGAGIEIYSSYWHINNHHSGNMFGSRVVGVVAALIIGAMALLIKNTGL